MRRKTRWSGNADFEPRPMGYGFHENQNRSVLRANRSLSCFHLGFAFLDVKACAVPGTLRRGVAVDKLDHCHGRVVTLAITRLHDPQITSLAILVPRRKRIEQAADGRLVA